MIQRGAPVAKTLKSAIASLFRKQLSGDEADAVVASLKKAGLLSFADSKVVSGAPDG